MVQVTWDPGFSKSALVMAMKKHNRDGMMQVLDCVDEYLIRSWFIPKFMDRNLELGSEYHYHIIWSQCALAIKSVALLSSVEALSRCLSFAIRRQDISKFWEILQHDEWIKILKPHIQRAIHQNIWKHDMAVQLNYTYRCLDKTMWQYLPKESHIIVLRDYFPDHITVRFAESFAGEFRGTDILRSANELKFINGF